ncbi:MAG: hypothetical protein IH991_02750 [Planctomycetes bacterium]|nr:hypothetical protein [Planctomycetota bacterium]
MDDFRSTCQMDSLANDWAEFAGARLSSKHRGVIRLDRPPKSCVVFGNDGFGVLEDGRAQREVDLFRCVLDTAQIAELGFGVHDDYSWAMIVGTDRVHALEAVLHAVWEAADQRTSLNPLEIARWLFLKS